MNSETASLDAVRGHTALYAVLWPHKEAMIKRWVDTVHGTYPFETIGFLRTRKDQFANPVGYRTEEAARALMDVIFSDTPDQEALTHAVDEIVRVRAIQDFPPEHAVGIFFAMKEILRETLMQTGQAEHLLPALLAVESRIDAVVLMAFGSYARNRETLHRLKVQEFKRQHSQILRLAEKKAGKDGMGLPEDV